jgi:Bifunctional DNA primase/polymerase, N-terminal
VFPLRPGSKRPAFPMHEAARCDRTDPWCRDGHAGWELRATTDPGRIGQAWGSAPYNIGIATGPARLVVVDLDQPKPGETAPPEWALPGVSDGADVLAVLCERHGEPLPYETYMIRTGRGGLHLYYTAPPGARLGNTAGSLGWLIDTRAAGGYTVAAGSAVDTPAGQRRYEIVYNRPSAELPAWLTGLLTPPTGSTASVACPLAAPPSGALPAYAAAAVQGEADRVLRSPEHGHNKALNTAAFNLGKRIAAGTVSREQAEQALQAAGQTVQPAETPARIAAVIRAGIDAGIRSATPAPRQGEAA